MVRKLLLALAGLIVAVAAVFAITARTAAGCSSSTTTATTASGTDSRKAPAPIPPGLPNHFVLGLANGPDDLRWMTSSGIPWDMRYQYLAGGVNTGKGWTTWQPAGSFVTQYMRDSAAHGYLPAFTYYQLFQSAPAAGSTEAEKDYNNLNTPATMRAYFADFKLLLDQVRAFGKPVLIHVEPDLSGYMQQRLTRRWRIGRQKSASDLPAAVASSGHPDAAGLPNTFQGFNWALLRMRDRFAPNAILAAHVSAWSTNVNVDSSTVKSSDLVCVGRTTADFLQATGVGQSQTGISSYDLLFFDPSDRDAAYYEQVQKDGGKHWWDPANQRAPNFELFAQYIKQVTEATNRRAILWQVPIGNTYFRTMNNTPGHYQDNRVQYFLGGYPNDNHIAQYADAGVIGILFGAGAPDQTTNTDAQKDGITNPPPINGNNATAGAADDDGGYLRMLGERYYRSGPYHLPGTSSP